MSGESNTETRGLSWWLRLAGGPFLAALIVAFFDLVPGKPQVTLMAGVTIWMAWWWLTEVVHLAVTSLLPMILLPLLGIAPAKLVAQQYMDQIMFLFIGGFVIAFAIERWNLHRRIALHILSRVGTRPSAILFGVMLTSAFISMWISNTATVMMLLSAVYAIINQVEMHIENPEQRRRFAAGVLIGLAYSASIGGMGTLVGTPTNMIFYRSYTAAFPQAQDMNFASWAFIAMPVSLLLLGAAFLVLKFMFIPKGLTIGIDKKFFRESLIQLGRRSYEENVVGILFLLTAVLWFLRSDIDFGSFRMRGWSSLFPEKYQDFLQESSVAVFTAILLFIWPSRNEKGRAIITWQEVSKMPFDIILLFGGGFALAYGFEASGLSGWLAGKLHFLDHANTWVLIAGLCLLVTVISEFASNVTSVQLILPILLVLHRQLKIDPLLLMIPATLSASLGFMLPVATAPNTIVFGSKRIKVSEMMRAGFIVDLAGIAIISLVMYLVS